MAFDSVLMTQAEAKNAHLCNKCFIEQNVTQIYVSVYI